MVRTVPTWPLVAVAASGVAVMATGLLVAVTLLSVEVGYVLVAVFASVGVYGMRRGNEHMERWEEA